MAKGTTAPIARRIVESFVVAGAGSQAFCAGQVWLFERESDIPETVRQHSEALLPWQSPPLDSITFDPDVWRSTTAPRPADPIPERPLQRADVQRELSWSDAEFAAAERDGVLPRRNGLNAAGAPIWSRATIARFRETLRQLGGKAAAKAGDASWGA